MQAHEISDDKQIQRLWQVDATSCGRPPADYNISIFCRTFNTPINDDWQPFIVEAGTDFMSFDACCPRDNGKNLWTLQRDCMQDYCYTSNLTIAGNFSKCINETAKVAVETAHKAGTLNDTSRPDQFWGRCEYIDYESLKKGIRDNISGSPQVHVGTSKALMNAVCVGLFLGSLLI